MLDISDIRAAKGFDDLSQDLKRFYIEFAYDLIADEFNKYDNIFIDRVEPFGNGVQVTFLKRIGDSIMDYKFAAERRV